MTPPHFGIFVIIFHLKRMWPFIFEQFRIPFSEGWFIQSLIEIGQLVLEKIFFNFSVFLLFCDYFSLEKSNSFHLNNSESPPPKDDLCQVWLKLAKWFWRRRQKCKSLQTDGGTDRRTTDNRRSEKLTWAFSSGELKSFHVIAAFLLVQWFMRRRFL
jgi:hypothetical protein